MDCGSFICLRSAHVKECLCAGLNKTAREMGLS